jgi:hypothetical protein
MAMAVGAKSMALTTAALERFDHKNAGAAAEIGERDARSNEAIE